MIACTIFGRPFVKRFALCYQTVVCLSVCFSVTLMHCGQMVGRIKIKRGLHVGLGPGQIVLDGDPASPPQKAGATPNFRTISVVAKWLHGSRCLLVGGRPWPRRLCVRWGPSSSSPKKAQPPFSANVRCGQTVG